MMKIYDDVNNLPEFKNAILTIGTFDGVHLGHQKIIHQLVEDARRVGGETVIMTFNPHPRKIIQPDYPLEMLNDFEEKAALLEKFGIDNLVSIRFNEDFANMPAEDYVQNLIYNKFNPQKVIIGYDHHFGKGRTGNIDLLRTMGNNLGFEAYEISAQQLNELIISSTKIRKALHEGNIQLANNHLGYHYTLNGKVVEGNKIGRTIGFPTANIQLDSADKLIPMNGVYAVKVLVNELEYNGMMNIGLRPTVNGKSRTIEVNILDFDEDIYYQPIKVSLYEYIRGEVKFDGIESLKQQIAKDKETVKECFG